MRLRIRSLKAITRLSSTAPPERQKVPVSSREAGTRGGIADEERRIHDLPPTTVVLAQHDCEREASFHQVPVG
jgi:hypothetical protein